MRLRIPDPWMFSLYALPLFFFPLSTAGSGIAMGLLIVAYGFSRHWRNWRAIGKRGWWLPWLLLMAWTAIGLLWTTNMFFGQIVTVSTFDAIFAFMGATLPWRERWVKWLIRWFLAGILLNEVLAFLITWQILPWQNTDSIPYAGFCDHIFLSLVLAHGILWLVYDQKQQWNFPRWANWLLIVVFALQMALTPGRSGQILLVLLLPIALFILYPGRWRWAVPVVGVLAAVGLFAIPDVRSHFSMGIDEIINFSPTKSKVTSSWGIRVVAIWAGILMFLQHPLIGVGTGNFYPTIVKLVSLHEIPETTGQMNTAANSYLSVAASQGIIGLALYLWTIFAFTKETWTSKITPWGWFFMTYFLIYLIGGMFNAMNWGYADAVTIALLAGLPLNKKSLNDAFN